MPNALLLGGALALAGLAPPAYRTYLPLRVVSQVRSAAFSSAVR